MNIFNNITQPEVLWLAAYLLIATLIGIFLYWAIISKTLKSLRDGHQKDQAKIKELSDENQAINSQISVHRADNKRLELGYAGLENTNQTLSSKNEGLSEALHESQNKEVQLRRQLQEQIERHQEAKINLEHAQQTINKFNVANSEAATKIEFLEGEIEALKAQNNELEIRRQTEIDALNTLLAASQNSLNESSNYILGIPDDTKELVEEVERLKAEIEEVQTNLAAAQTKAVTLEEERNDYRNKLTYTEGELAALKKMYSSTQEDFIALKTQRDKIDAHSAEMDATNEEKIIALEADLMSMEMAYNNVKRDLDLMVEEQIANDTQITSLNEELVRVNGELSAVKAMYSSTQDDFIALKTQRDEIDAHSAEMASEQEEKMTTINADLESMEMAYNNIKQDMDNMVAERQAKETELTELKSKIERLETEKKVQEEMLQFWKEDYEKLKTEYEEDPELEITKLQVNQLKVRLATLQAEKEIADEEIGHLKDEMTKLKSDYDDDPELEITKLQMKQLKLRLESVIEDKEKAEEEVGHLRDEMTKLKSDYDDDPELEITKLQMKQLKLRLESVAEDKEKAEEEIVYLKEELEKQREEYEDDPELAITLLQNKQLKRKVELLESEVVGLEADIQRYSQAALAVSNPNLIETTPVTITDSDFPTETESKQATDYIHNLIGKVLPETDAEKKDSLTHIRGIGRFLEKQLNELGIYTYEQISLWDSNIIEQVTTAIGYFPGRIEKDAWVSQAKKLFKEKS